MCAKIMQMCWHRIRQIDNFTDTQRADTQIRRYTDTYACIAHSPLSLSHPLLSVLFSLFCRVRFAICVANLTAVNGFVLPATAPPFCLSAPLSLCQGVPVTVSASSCCPGLDWVTCLLALMFPLSLSFIFCRYAAAAAQLISLRGMPQQSLNTRCQLALCVRLSHSLDLSLSLSVSLSVGVCVAPK